MYHHHHPFIVIYEDHYDEYDDDDDSKGFGFIQAHFRDIWTNFFLLFFLISFLLLILLYSSHHSLPNLICTLLILTAFSLTWILPRFLLTIFSQNCKKTATHSALAMAKGINAMCQTIQNSIENSVLFSLFFFCLLPIFVAFFLDCQRRFFGYQFGVFMSESLKAAMY